MLLIVKYQSQWDWLLFLLTSTLNFPISYFTFLLVRSVTVIRTFWFLPKLYHLFCLLYLLDRAKYTKENFYGNTASLSKFHCWMSTPTKRESFYFFEIDRILQFYLRDSSADTFEILNVFNLFCLVELAQNSNCFF